MGVHKVLNLILKSCRKNNVLVICSMLFGYLIFLWKEFKVMELGLYFVQMRLQV